MGKHSVFDLRNSIRFLFMFTITIFPALGECGKDKTEVKFSSPVQCSDTDIAKFTPPFSASSYHLYSTRAGVVGDRASFSETSDIASIVPTMAMVDQIKTVVGQTFQDFTKTVMDSDATVTGYSLGDYQITPETVKKDYPKVYKTLVVIDDCEEETEDDKIFANELFGSGLCLTTLILDVCNEICDLKQKSEGAISQIDNKGGREKYKKQYEQAKSKLDQASNYIDRLRHLFIFGGVQLLCHIKDRNQLLLVINKLSEQRCLVNFVTEMERMSKFAEISSGGDNLEDFALSLSKGYQVLHSLLFNFQDDAGYALLAVFDQILIDPPNMKRLFYASPMFFVFSATVWDKRTRDHFLMRTKDGMVDTVGEGKTCYEAKMQEVKHIKSDRLNPYRGVLECRAALVKYLEETFYTCKESRDSLFRKRYEKFSHADAELIADRWVYALLNQKALYADLNGVHMGVDHFSETVLKLFNHIESELHDNMRAQALIAVFEHPEPVKIIRNLTELFERNSKDAASGQTKGRADMARYCQGLGPKKPFNVKDMQVIISNYSASSD